MPAGTHQFTARLLTAEGTTAVLPRQRRVARRVPNQSPQRTLQLVMHEAMQASWQPAAAAARVLAHVQDLHVLRVVRARVRLAGLDRATLSQARALATLNMAITQLEDGADTLARVPEQRGRGRAG
jgi:hypothetical protein